MFCLDWLQAGRATRGKPRLRGRSAALGRSWVCWPLSPYCKADVNQGRSAIAAAVAAAAAVC